jgi:hypothetical protein
MSGRLIIGIQTPAPLSSQPPQPTPPICHLICSRIGLGDRLINK